MEFAQWSVDSGHSVAGAQPAACGQAGFQPLMLRLVQHEQSKGSGPILFGTAIATGEAGSLFMGHATLWWRFAALAPVVSGAVRAAESLPGFAHVSPEC